jgi:hypothetical protein
MMFFSYTHKLTSKSHSAGQRIPYPTHASRFILQSAIARVFINSEYARGAHKHFIPA